ncbi:MAG: dTDP-4-dehydrorhamnose reductase [Arcobacter sp.]|uniref:SDR family oxidoreductase n=1 Tax=uncultured Arcobacter sp. TaxID=165434 RepID=UPI000CA7AB20|nr:NAD(P)-dependent oxidoreductase [uncultured Arcobacter sp.]PLY10493.1 MAG: dTDP-4-dehydrorhamnose reductase [Arcobacter sp.]
MHGKKILITGKNGMLGSSLISNLKYNNIVGIDSTIDLTNNQQVCKKIKEVKPDIIIHTAAYTDVESCETNQDKSYLVNTLMTQNLVNYCINQDILFVYISSTGIYGRSKDDRYNEFDEVNPTTVHHKSKFEGEKIVRNHLNKYLILRTGWLYGGDKNHRKNFVYKRYLEAIQNGTLYSDNTQIGNPTYISDFVEQIEVLIENQQFGIFNCVNSASNISRYDYVKKIIEFFDIDCEVKVAPQGMFKRIAPVSHNESAYNYKLELLNLNIMKKWEVSLKIYINLLKKGLE